MITEEKMESFNVIEWFLFLCGNFFEIVKNWRYLMAPIPIFFELKMAVTVPYNELRRKQKTNEKIIQGGCKNVF